MLTNHYAGFAGIAHPHFELDMYLPVPTKLNLGSGIATKKLILSARLEIPVAHFRTAEIHTLPDANMPNVEPTGQTTGWWENLLGIGSKVKVGPNL